MHAGTTQLLLGYHLAQNGLHNGGAGEEHVRGVLHHQSEVGKRGAVNGTSGAGTHNGGNLRNHTAGHDVALENLAIAGQCVDTFLQTGTTRVVQTDYGSTHLHGDVHNLANLAGQHLTQRTCCYGEILCENINQTAANGSATSYHTIAQIVLLVHTEVCTTVLNEHVHFFETSVIEQHGDAFAGGVLTFLVLLGNSLLTTTKTSLDTEFYQLLDLFCLSTHFFMNNMNNYCIF